VFKTDAGLNQRDRAGIHFVWGAVDGEDAVVLVSMQAPVARIMIDMGRLQPAMTANAAVFKLGAA
jgi:hypothetical protein